MRFFRILLTYKNGELLNTSGSRHSYAAWSYTGYFHLRL